jgi:hypothetical protein
VVPAFQTDGCSEWNAAGECTYVNEGPGQGDSWEAAAKPNGKGVGADNGFGEDWSHKDDGNNTYSHDLDVGWKLPQPSAEEKKINDWVKKEGSDFPTWITDDDKFGEALLRRSHHKVCTKLLRHVQQRISQIGLAEFDEDSVFDWIKNPSDKKLRRLENTFDSEGCHDVLGVPF